MEIWGVEAENRVSGLLQLSFSNRGGDFGFFFEQEKNHPLTIYMQKYSVIVCGVASGMKISFCNKLL